MPHLFSETLLYECSDVVSNLFVGDGDLSLQLNRAPGSFSKPQEDLVTDRVPEDFEDMRISPKWQSNPLNHFGVRPFANA